MTSVISYRGPDGFGYHVDDLAFLGHRRLSIIDVQAGHQPIYNETGSVCLTYNGEIFNHASLRPDLEAAGHRYKTRSDTETIVHAYEQYGPDCVSRFRGMFAFAIWDARAKTLFCARDRLGIKPFYYFSDGRIFAFASEIKALLEHPAISPSVDESLLPEYLAFGYGSSDRTLFRGIRKLMPGHHLTLEVKDGGSLEPRIERYWDAPRPTHFETRSEQEWIRDCRARLEETVRMRLMSDVPLGMFLSGGVDSSAIAAIMRRQVSTPVKTFAVGYREEQYSELTWARQVAGVIGTEHREVVIGMEDFFNALPDLVWHEDEPIAWPSSVSLYFVSKLAASEVKVVLTGEGSDELFAGYERYGHYLFNMRWLAFYRGVPAAARRSIRENIASTSILSGTWRRKLLHTFIGREESFESLQLDNFYCAFPIAEQQRLFPGLDSSSDAIYGDVLKYWSAASDSAVLPRMLYTDIKTYLVELLMKQDQMSMACSIESRVPFLDHPLVEFAATVPPDMKIRGGVRKYILKRAVEDILPHEIVHRKKMGFPTPLRQWLREPGAKNIYSILQDPQGVLAAYTDRAAVADLISRHQQGSEDATDRIWRLLNFQIWGDLFVTGKRDVHAGGLMPGTAGSAR
jgi:asparagine synthase (glutamine-hydrolysing)